MLLDSVKALIHKGRSEKLSSEELSLVALSMQQARDYRLDLEKQAAAVKKEESDCNEVLVAQLRAEKQAFIAGGKMYTLGQTEYVPHVMDWDKFYEFIVESRDFTLLERRPGRSSCQSRWDQGEEVPGVEKYPVYKLSVTKT